MDVSPPKRTTLVLVTATAVAFAAVAAVLGAGIILGMGTEAGGATSGTVLPAWCVRPANGFLIVQSKYGYNDSITEGAGLSKPWPVVTVKEGQTVNIAVCNIDVEAHGFQIANYVDGSINAVEPGKVLSVSFVATKQGSFLIYCAIPCSIHFFMQFGQLKVTA